MTKPLATGTKVTVRQAGGVLEPARIARWTKAQGPRDESPGWHVVEWAHGGKSVVHEGAFA